MIPAKTNLIETGARGFEFARDSFAFPNELVWEYRMDAAARKRILSPRIPKPGYVHRCFALARVARQFFYHARFLPGKDRADREFYGELIRAILARHPRIPCNDADKIIFPGFEGLREFSRAHEKLFKAECGGAWRSYFLRSHWRMAFPFFRGHQMRTALALTTALEQNRLPILHLVKFPAMTINHCIILFNVTETGRGWEFESYDPNNAVEPERLAFDRVSRTFSMSPNACWPGGELNVSHIYRSWFF